MTTTQTNPGRPPKHWMRRCIKGVASGKGAADPGAVCGSLWHHKLSDSQRRAILKEERAMGGLVENPRELPAAYHKWLTKVHQLVAERTGYTSTFLRRYEYGLPSAYFSGVKPKEGARILEVTLAKRGYAENPLSGGALAAVAAGLGLVGVVAYLALRKKDEPAPATSFTGPGGKSRLPPPPTSPPCVVDPGKLHVFAQSRGMLAVYLPACPPATPPVQNLSPPVTPCWDSGTPPPWAGLWMSVMLTAAPTVPVLLVLSDGGFWTYGGSPPVATLRADLRAAYCEFAAGSFTVAPEVFMTTKGVDPGSLFIL